LVIDYSQCKKFLVRLIKVATDTAFVGLMTLGIFGVNHLMLQGCKVCEVMWWFLDLTRIYCNNWYI